MSDILENVPKEIIDQYFQMSRDLALSTDQTLDQKLVFDLTQAHRKMMGFETNVELLVYDSPIAACEAHEELRPSNAFFGSLDAGWLMSAMCARDHAGDTSTAELSILMELCKHVGWFWLCDTHTILTYRPTQICLEKNDEGSEYLHNYNDLALKYRDGKGVAVFKGTYLPLDQYWAVEATTLDKAKLKTCDDKSVIEAIKAKFKGEKK